MCKNTVSQYIFQDVQKQNTLRKIIFKNGVLGIPNCEKSHAKSRKCLSEIPQKESIVKLCFRL